MEKIKSKFNTILKYTIGSFSLLSVIHKLLFQIKKIDFEDKSMQPSIKIGDYIFIWKLEYPYTLKKKPFKGLVYINHPYEKTKIVRYITANQGEWIKSRNSEIYNRIPQGYCWVESIKGEDDSNQWGPIPIALVFGQPKFKIRLFKKFVTRTKIENNFKNKTNYENRLLKQSDVDQIYKFL